LSVGDRLRTVSGGSVTVESVTVTGQIETVWNLSAAGPHTYHVTTSTTDPGAGLLVHNANAPTGAVCGVEAEAARLQTRADVIHGALDPGAQNGRATAVLSTDTDQDILASGGRDPSPAQRRLAVDGDILAKEDGVHAELTALNEAVGRGLTPQQLAASRPICPGCQTQLESAGARITSPTTARWAP
jgi:hypothetical protein